MTETSGNIEAVRTYTNQGLKAVNQEKLQEIGAEIEAQKIRTVISGAREVLKETANGYPNGFQYDVYGPQEVSKRESLVGFLNITGVETDVLHINYVPLPPEEENTAFSVDVSQTGNVTISGVEPKIASETLRLLMGTITEGPYPEFARDKSTLHIGGSRSLNLVYPDGTERPLRIVPPSLTDEVITDEGNEIIYEDDLIMELSTPEGKRVITKHPLVRNLAMEGIINILQNKGDLNTLTEQFKTFFFVYPDSSFIDDANKTTYSDGGAELGIFIVFPIEGNSKLLTLTHNTWRDAEEIAIPARPENPQTVIPYNEYLFIPPHLYDVVATAANIKEASSRLETQGFNRDKFESGAVVEAKETIKIREQLEDLIFYSDNPPFHTGHELLDFYRKMFQSTTNELSVAEYEIYLIKVIRSLKSNEEKKTEIEKEKRSRRFIPEIFSQSPSVTRKIAKELSLITEDNYQERG